MKSLLVVLSLFALHPAHAASPKAQVIELQVTEDGFVPAEVNAKPGVPVTLKVTRKTDATCATSISIPAKKIKKDLPLDKTVTVALGKLEKGEIRFACSMDMISGKILVK